MTGDRGRCWNTAARRSPARCQAEHVKVLPLSRRSMMVLATFALFCAFHVRSQAAVWPRRPGANSQNPVLAATIPQGASGEQSVREEEKEPASPILSEAMAQVRRLVVRVQRGEIVSGFGNQAQKIIGDATARVDGATAEQLGQALDGALNALFLQQLTTLRENLLSKFAKDKSAATALNRADEQFVATANDLVRPGSSWTFDADRAMLQKLLAALLHRDVFLARQRVQAERSQRATADVVGKLSAQLERLGELIHGAGGGSDVVFWTNYQFPGTPVQLSARYQDGRSNIEFSLAPAGDPANAEAGFVTGLTPQNLGLSLNVGF